tara:strand:- start:776 stop:898 length:123 start_codon:yes stop_codon:yes gene_type:complete
MLDVLHLPDPGLGTVDKEIIESEGAKGGHTGEHPVVQLAV